MSREKKTPKSDKWYFFYYGIIIGIMLGYGVRMWQDEGFQKGIEEMFTPSSKVFITPHSLSTEIKSGRSFWLPIGDGQALRFLPLRKTRFEMAVRHERMK